MSSLEKYSKIKYRCNHPDSEFEGATTNPIELKKEKFVEYTHRNEVESIQNDTVKNMNSFQTTYPQNNKNNLSRSTTSNMYSQNRINYTAGNSNVYFDKKKSLTGWFWIIFVLFFLPSILELLASLLDSFIETMY